jgi:hypothetical protein
MKNAYGFLKVALLGMFLVLALTSMVPQPGQALAGGHCDPINWVCKYHADGGMSPGMWHEEAR